MLSYARHAEDVVLARAFAGQPAGFYVDVGARHPDEDSVTKHFYDLGWSGITVVPATADDALFGAARPRDLHLRAEATTLAGACAHHVTGPIDFLRIDAAGGEEAVIRGGDWTRDRPRVVVVLATAPDAPVPAHQGWEPLLLGAGYQVALFDGLNRFYVRAEDAPLRSRLAAPANPHDRWEPARYVRRIAELERHAADLQARREVAEEYAGSLAQHAVERERYAADVREHLERSQAWARVLEAKVRRFETHLGLLPGTLPPVVRYTLDEVVEALDAARADRPPLAAADRERWVARLRAGAALRELVDALLGPADREPAGADTLR